MLCVPATAAKEERQKQHRTERAEDQEEHRRAAEPCQVECTKEKDKPRPSASTRESWWNDAGFESFDGDDGRYPVADHQDGQFGLVEADSWRRNETSQPKCQASACKTC